MAGRLNTDWFVVYVETPGEAPDRIDAEAQRHLLANIEQRARARRRGRAPAGRATRWPRSSTSRARTASATSSSAARTSRGGGSCSAARVPLRLVREAAGFDVHIVSLDEEEDARRDACAPSCCSRRLPLRRWRWSSSASVASLRPTRARPRARRRSCSDNYRSVLAAQRMKEAIERIDSARAVPASRASASRARAQIDAARRSFESELRVQEGNITEPGERRGDRDACARPGTSYRSALDALRARDRRRDAARASTSTTLQPALPRGQATRRRRSSRSTRTRWCARASARSARRERLNTLLLAVAVARLPRWACSRSALLTARLLRPLGGAAPGRAPARRGRPRGARARSTGSDEIAQLAASSTPWPSACRRTARARSASCSRRSSASQAAIDSLPDPVARVRRRRASCCTANRAAETAARRCGSQSRPRRRSTRRCARCSSACARTCSAGKGAYVPKGLEEARARRDARTASGASCRAARRSTPRRAR